MSLLPIRERKARKVDTNMTRAPALTLVVVALITAGCAADSDEEATVASSSAVTSGGAIERYVAMILPGDDRAAERAAAAAEIANAVGAVASAASDKHLIGRYRGTSLDGQPVTFELTRDALCDEHRVAYAPGQHWDPLGGHSSGGGLARTHCGAKFTMTIGAHRGEGTYTLGRNFFGHEYLALRDIVYAAGGGMLQGASSTFGDALWIGAEAPATLTTDLSWHAHDNPHIPPRQFVMTRE